MFPAPFCTNTPFILGYGHLASGGEHLETHTTLEGTRFSVGAFHLVKRWFPDLPAHDSYKGEQVKE